MLKRGIAVELMESENLRTRDGILKAVEHQTTGPNKKLAEVRIPQIHTIFQRIKCH